MTPHVVLHASAYDEFPSGARNRAVGLAAALLRLGCRVTVQTPARLRFEPLVEHELGRPVPRDVYAEVATRLDPRRPLLRLQRSAAEARRALPPDTTLFVTDYHPVVEGVPTALTVHDLRYVVAARDESPFRVAAFRASFPAIARRAEMIVVPSRAVAAEVHEHVGIHTRRVVVSPNAPGRTWRDAAPIEGPGRHLVVVGIGDARKRFNLLVEALRRARARGPVLPVVAAWRLPGEPEFAWLRSDDLKSSHALRFDWAPTDTELVRIVSEAAALLHPSRYEGFGLPVLEAFSCGVPVIATRVPAVEEVAGSLARFVADDADAWADALLAVSADPAARTRGRDARRARAAEFTWDAAARALLDGFARLRE